MHLATRPHKSFIFRFMCDWSFCICIHANSASSPAKTSPHITSQTLQVHVEMPSKVRTFLIVNLPFFYVLLFFSSRIEALWVCVNKNSTQASLLDRDRRWRYKRFGHFGGVMATHRICSDANNFLEAEGELQRREARWMQLNGQFLFIYYIALKSKCWDFMGQ